LAAEVPWHYNLAVFDGFDLCCDEPAAEVGEEAGDKPDAHEKSDEADWCDAGDTGKAGGREAELTNGVPEVGGDDKEHGGFGDGGGGS